MGSALCIVWPLPVLAYVERYAYVDGDWHVLGRWVQRGCLAQVDASSWDRMGGDDVAQGLTDRVPIASTATDEHSATRQVPHGLLE